MKFIFRTETEVLKELDLLALTDELEDELAELFDNRPIKKYDLVFKEGLTVYQCHNIRNVRPEMLESLTITVA